MIEGWTDNAAYQEQTPSRVLHVATWEDGNITEERLAVACIAYRIGLIMNDSDIWVILIKDADTIHIHKMFTIQTDNHTLKPALLVIDVQNGFISKGGSYDKLGMDTSSYRSVIPKMQQLVSWCREVGIPIFYT